MDEQYLKEALALAAQAEAIGEVPVGAVAVRDGTIIGRGFNRRESDRDPLSHAELIAIKQAASALNAWRLTGVTLYVTLEPCAMCAGAMLQARIARLVYGAKDPKGGAAGSLYNLLDDPRHNHRVQLTGGVLEAQCKEVLSGFFWRLRNAAPNK